MQRTSSPDSTSKRAPRTGRTPLLAALALALGSSVASAQFDFDIDWPDIEDVVPFVINPIGGMVEQLAEPLGEGVGLDPDQLRLFMNPFGAVVEHAPEMVSAAAQAEFDRLQAELSAVRELLTGDLDELQESAGDWLSAWGDRALNAGLVKMLQPLLSPTVPWFLRDTFMDEPNLVFVNPNAYSGDPVYYVNGMDTSFQDAEDEAVALGDQLGRPILLLYNPTSGGARDLAEAVYDRTWPFLANFVQANPITRQVTYVLYHSGTRVSIVSHSQGCLIVRNALLTANAFSGGSVRKKVAWVATGLPLRDDELYPRCARFRAIANPEDPVAQVAGVRLDGDVFEQDPDEHSFVRAYVSRISPSDVWPSPFVWFEGIQVQHNVQVPHDGGGFLPGMRISARMSAQNLRGEECRAVAYFAFENEQRLGDFNRYYTTDDGQVSTGTDFRPAYESASYRDLTLTIPYVELHLVPGRHSLKFHVQTYVKASGQVVGTSWDEFFTVTH